MLRHWDDLSGYEDLLNFARDLQEGNRTLLQTAKLLANILRDDWGLTTLVGGIPLGADRRRSGLSAVEDSEKGTT